jgi:very-short-patch-repair endonuclease
MIRDCSTDAGSCDASRRKQNDSFGPRYAARILFGIKFFRQYSVGTYILDFFSPAVKLAIELDGGQHNLPESREYDAARSEFLRSHGIEVVRFWNHDILQNMVGVLTSLEEHPRLAAKG